VISGTDVHEVFTDIKPGSATNPVNLKSNGVIPVAILTTSHFNAQDVDPLSVRFGRGMALEADGRGHLEDVDGDGDLDLVLHFRITETGITPGDTAACLIGKTRSGIQLLGCDVITIVP